MFWEYASVESEKVLCTPEMIINPPEMMISQVRMLEESQRGVPDILYTDNPTSIYICTNKHLSVSKIQYWTFLAFWAVEYYLPINHFVINSKTCTLSAIPSLLPT